MKNNNKDYDEKCSLNAPRNMQIVATKYLALGFLLFGSIILLTILIVVLSGKTTIDNFSSIIFLSLMSIIPIIIGLTLDIIPERYRTKVYFDRINNELKLTKKGRDQTIKLHGFTSIISKTIGYPFGGTKHFLILKNDSNQIELLKEQCGWRGSHWVVFSNDLAILTGLNFTKEHWAEDINGKLIQIKSVVQPIVNKRLMFVITMGLLPLVCAIAYKVDPTRNNFILYGLSAILISNGLFIFYNIKNAASIADRVKRILVLMISVIMITFNITLFYTGYSFFLNGLTLPGIIKQ